MNNEPEHDPLCHDCTDQAELIDLLLHAIDTYQLYAPNVNEPSYVNHRYTLIGLAAAARLTGANFTEINAALGQQITNARTRSAMIDAASRIAAQSLITQPTHEQEPTA